MYEKNIESIFGVEKSIHYRFNRQSYKKIDFLLHRHVIMSKIKVLM